MKESSCSHGVGAFALGLLFGLGAGTFFGVALCPSRRSMKKMAKATADNVADAVDHLRDSLHPFL